MTYQYDEFQKNFWNEKRVGALTHKGQLIKELYSKEQLREKLSPCLIDVLHTLIDGRYWVVVKPGERVTGPKRVLDLYNKRVINKVFPYEGNGYGGPMLDGDLYNLLRDPRPELVNSCSATYGEAYVKIVLESRHVPSPDAPPKHLYEIIDNDPINIQIKKSINAQNKETAMSSKFKYDSEIVEALRIVKDRGIDPVALVSSRDAEMAQALEVLHDRLGFDPLDVLVGKTINEPSAAEQNLAEDDESNHPEHEVLHDPGVVTWVNNRPLGLCNPYEYCTETNTSYPIKGRGRKALFNVFRRVSTLRVERTDKGIDQRERTVAPGIIVPEFRKIKDGPAEMLKRIPDYNRSRLLLN